MILTGIIAFVVMCVVGFVIGCGIAEWEIWKTERKDHDD